MAPSKVVVVVVCENEITKDGISFVCGKWMVITRGEELPHCHACKLPQRTWRIATDQEIDANDRAFLRAIERIAPTPDDHLGWRERS